MNAIKLSAGCIVLTVSQLAAAAGPYIYRPIPIHNCCAGVNSHLGTAPRVGVTPQLVTSKQQINALFDKSGRMQSTLDPSIKISPRFVSTYEPSINGWVATPRLRVSDASRSTEITRLTEVLRASGSTEVPATLVDPAWMQKHRDRHVLLEDPLPLK